MPGTQRLALFLLELSIFSNHNGTAMKQLRRSLCAAFFHESPAPPSFGLTRSPTTVGAQRPWTVAWPTYSRSVAYTSSTFCSRADCSEYHVPPQKIAIVGGGLAGLSTTYHLLDKWSRDDGHNLQVTVFDTETEAGQGGASAVAGGLLHPLSPRGKLVHYGLEGLEASNRFIRAACEAAKKCDTVKGVPSNESGQSSIVLRDHLFRIALTDEHVKQLKKTAKELPDLCEWIDPDELRLQIPSAASSSNTAIKGGLRMYNGCQAVHLPSYLKGLWRACQLLSSEKGERTDWFTVADSDYYTSPETTENELDNMRSLWRQRLEEYDSVVLAAGAGLFDNSVMVSQNSSSLPIQLVRGQSLEIGFSDNVGATSPNADHPALICGKYVSPLPGGNRILVGSTYEYNHLYQSRMPRDRVVKELKTATCHMAPHLWEGSNDCNDRAPNVERVISGVRVQTQRGALGRRPIIGRIPSNDDRFILHHNNTWIFTGLSSRGLLYHALYGDILTDAILGIGTEHNFLCNEEDDMVWWR